MEPKNNNNMENEITKGFKAAGQAGKQVGKKIIKAGAKVVAKVGVKALGVLAGLIGLPALIIGVLAIIAILFMTTIYWAMPENGLLAGLGMEQTELDIEIKESAVETTDKSNIINTYIVEGEGRQYPKKGLHIGQLVDKEGKDIKLANQWGDVYAPVLWKANTYIDDEEEEPDNKMEDISWVKKEFFKVSKLIQPYFYYKESIITVCSTDSEGETTCYSYEVFLLVEAFTIRGHNLYTYEWVTEGDEDSSTTYEKLKDIEVIDDGKIYFDEFLEEYLQDLGDAEEEKITTSQFVWESMQGFTAETEWMAWLNNKGYIQSRLVSASMIPAEYRGFLEEASNITGIPINVLAAIITKESSWNVNAVNTVTGCFGLTQLHPDYWKEWALRYGFNPETDKTNPRAQIIIGARVLADYFPQNVNFDNENWYTDSSFRVGLAKYGGYGDNVDSAGAYIDNIVNLANAFNREAVWPVPSRTMANITSFFGYRKNPTDLGAEYHDGVDIAGTIGETVVSSSGGVVVYTGWERGYGQAIFIEDGTYMYIYGHLDSVAVTAGQIVNPNQKIGTLGNTGRSTGPHLHFGVKLIGNRGFVDPLSILL